MHPDTRPPRDLSRRDALRAGAVGAAAALAPVAPRARAHAPEPQRRARNLIFLVSDGMSAGTLTLADRFLRDQDRGESAWLAWLRDAAPRQALVHTHSADAHVTDSAAASSAWSTGRLVNNGSLCITPDGRAPLPLLPRCKAVGKKTAVVTTTRVTHATPAAFLVNVPRRDDEAAVARQYISRGVDLAFGGGASRFPEDLTRNRTTLRTRDDLRAWSPRLSADTTLGLFANDHMAYTIDQAHDQPTLAEMTAAALRALDAAPDGFVLQIEGGRVDHAAHNNDIAAILHDQIALDQTLAAVLTFLKDRDDTLLIATTDHGNANPGLHYYGPEGREKFARVQRATRSFEWIFAAFKTGPDRTPTRLAELVQQATGVELDRDERAVLERVLNGDDIDPHRPRNGPTSALGSILANHFAVAFVGPNHTADAVHAAAAGPGSERLAPVMHLADFLPLIESALGLPPAPEPAQDPALIGAGLQGD